MVSGQQGGDFGTSLDCLISSPLEKLAVQLTQVVALQQVEREAILTATRQALLAVLHGKLTRLLLLELNAARVNARLDGDSAEERWTAFQQLTCKPDYWQSLAPHYPGLAERVDTLVSHRCAAALMFANRWCNDRHLLPTLLHATCGLLLEVTFGAGDSHCGGQSVVLVRCTGGPLVYKPRSVAIDLALAQFVQALGEKIATNMHVPHAIDCGHYGWVEFVTHRQADTPSAQRDFYRASGHWLAVMRLLAGTDLHAGNLIAHGSAPTIIDCETLFTPRLPAPASGLGEAADRVAATIAGTAANIGMLPSRATGLGWRGADHSALGSIPGQQPEIARPEMIDAGTDKARIGLGETRGTLETQNLPNARPELARYWPDVLAGFGEMTQLLQEMDARAALGPHLEGFAGCVVRFVARPTETYAEIGRMLWHPVSLHNPEQARQRAYSLMLRMADNMGSVPKDSDVLNAEIDDLLSGDIPYFSATTDDGCLAGPGNTRWKIADNLIANALADWRNADIALEREVIQASLISAFVNDGWMPEDRSLLPAVPQQEDAEQRRRQQLCVLMRQLVGNAVIGKDGSIAWLAPVLAANGWSVQPLGPDVYNGIAGMAMLLAAYRRESAEGRADPVDGIEHCLQACITTMIMGDAKRSRLMRDGIRFRPLPPGGYIGLGSQLWAYLVLADFGIEAALDHAIALAQELPDAAQADQVFDILTGCAGAIVPMLALARHTQDQRHLETAVLLGNRICEAGTRDGEAMHWVHTRWPEGVGGFAHGVTGIGWALTKLARATGCQLHTECAQAAFAFEDGLYDHAHRNWRDLRMLAGNPTAAAWCHGAVGIGLAHADLDPQLTHTRTREVLRIATDATRRQGLGWNHCACHGDLGAWELFDTAARLQPAKHREMATELLGSVLTSIEEHGACCGLLRDTLSPGLMPGLGGIAYQLLRAHPQHRVPSILLQGGLEI
ncbi:MULTISPECIES: type 2 lanthipeptide synthetase LanM family protein [unclassified Xanthomonas]|uniref:type 2 lanthipeptide synthetase LanM family protein n=1 Tax=unclassified Xanthomonas TaxID=2643310 RepID=UPI002B22B37C|nr:MULTISPECIES: type 2 lanthipeptide synthetase LanM family protein [unclassified Xanthomonas]MEA9563586.1 type 2 lanthipeptide synthetase LanM family protein [Xanthomonas sp. WHRI 8932A]MEA9634270.1 type 2 lanthipeptide synthetase LanM family protein [Xanthomonas sp. WHRI 8812E]